MGTYLTQLLSRYLCQRHTTHICSCLCLAEVRMNYSESDFNDLVVMIKKSETADLMDYTNSGQGLLSFFSLMNNLEMMTTFRQFKRWENWFLRLFFNCPLLAGYPANISVFPVGLFQGENSSHPPRVMTAVKWRWWLSTREPSSSGWVASRKVDRSARASTSRFPAWNTRRSSIWERPRWKSHLRRFSVGSLSTVLSNLSSTL